MDPVLLPYLRATSDSEREEHLDELILFRAAPLVRRILRRRLGLHLSDQGTNRDNHEAEDLYQETITKIVQTVRTLRSSSHPTDIGDFRGYVASITNNACVDFLRAKSPAKYRLKHAVRDVFTRHQDFRTVTVSRKKKITCSGLKPCCSEILIALARRLSRLLLSAAAIAHQTYTPPLRR